MITQETAKYLLDMYKIQLENLQFLIEKDKIPKNSRADGIIIPNVLSALEAIASGQPTFKPNGFIGAKTINLPNNPNECIQFLLNDIGINFDEMMKSYNESSPLYNTLFGNINAFRNAIDPSIALPKPDKGPQVMLYRTNEDKLAVKFPDLDSRDAFLKEFGSKVKNCPESYKDNPTIYFPGEVVTFKSGGGLLKKSKKTDGFVADFGSNEKKDKFIDLLLKTNYGINDPSASEFQTQINRNMKNGQIYFKDPVFLANPDLRKNVTISLSDGKPSLSSGPR